MKKFEVSYNARNVAIKEAYFGNKVIIKNPNPGAKENAASMARNQELEQRNQVKLLFHPHGSFSFAHDRPLLTRPQDLNTFHNKISRSEIASSLTRS